MVRLRLGQRRQNFKEFSKLGMLVEPEGSPSREAEVGRLAYPDRILKDFESELQVVAVTKGFEDEVGSV